MTLVILADIRGRTQQRKPWTISCRMYWGVQLEALNASECTVTTRAPPTWEEVLEVSHRKQTDQRHQHYVIALSWRRGRLDRCCHRGSPTSWVMRLSCPATNGCCQFTGLQRQQFTQSHTGPATSPSFTVMKKVTAGISRGRHSKGYSKQGSAICHNWRVCNIHLSKTRWWSGSGVSNCAENASSLWAQAVNS